MKYSIVCFLIMVVCGAISVSTDIAADVANDTFIDDDITDLTGLSKENYELLNKKLTENTTPVSLNSDSVSDTKALREEKEPSVSNSIPAVNSNKLEIENELNKKPDEETSHTPTTVSTLVELKSKLNQFEIEIDDKLKDQLNVEETPSSSSTPTSSINSSDSIPTELETNFEAVEKKEETPVETASATTTTLPDESSTQATPTPTTLPISDKKTDQLEVTSTASPATLSSGNITSDELNRLNELDNEKIKNNDTLTTSFVAAATVEDTSLLDSTTASNTTNHVEHESKSDETNEKSVNLNEKEEVQAKVEETSTTTDQVSEPTEEIFQKPDESINQELSDESTKMQANEQPVETSTTLSTVNTDNLTAMSLTEETTTTDKMEGKTVIESPAIIDQQQTTPTETQTTESVDLFLTEPSVIITEEKASKNEKEESQLASTPNKERQRPTTYRSLLANKRLKHREHIRHEENSEQKPVEKQPPPQPDVGAHLADDQTSATLPPNEEKPAHQAEDSFYQSYDVNNQTDQHHTNETKDHHHDHYNPTSNTIDHDTSDPDTLTQTTSTPIADTTESLEKDTIMMAHILTNPNESVTDTNNIAVTQIGGNVEYTTAESILNVDSAHYHHHQQVKYCADFRPIKDLFNQHIEQFYKPVISLLPEDFQLVLLDETHIAGLNTAACLLIICSLSIFLAVWFVYLKRKQREQHMQTVRLNEKMLIIENSLKKMTFEKQTFESEYQDLEVKYADAQKRLNEQDDKLNKSNDMCAQLTQTNNLNHKEIEKLKSAETKLSKEVTALKIELANSRQQSQSELEEHEVRVSQLNGEYQLKVNDLTSQLAQFQHELESKSQLSYQLEQQVSHLKANESKQNETLESKEKMIKMLQNSLLQMSKKDIIEINTELTDEPLVVVNNVNTQPHTFDGLIKIAELQMDIKNLEDQLAAERSQLQLKSAQILSLEERVDERQTLITRLELRQKELEKVSKDQEMQIRLLNELREKDTKQHLKALSDLDSQLKKKSNDADKISHFLEQLRVKQERIQELETQLARLERQANQERQQNDKQTHENWLQARKIEKELKETRLELTNLKEKCAELEILNKNLNENNQLMRQTLPGKQTMMAAQSAAQSQSNGFFMSPSNYAYQQQQMSRHSIDSTSLPNNGAVQSKEKTDDTTTTTHDPTHADQHQQVDQPLQLDTLMENRQASSSSPSTSSTSGHVHNHSSNPAAAGMHPNMNPYMNPYMIRPPGAPVPFRYPFPLPSPAAYMQQQQQQQLTDSDASSTPNRPMIPPVAYPPTAYAYRMPFYQQQQHQQQYLQQQYQQFQQSKSASSSQMPSPNTSLAANTMPYSHTYPGQLNDSVSTKENSQNQLEEAVNEACQDVNGSPVAKTENSIQPTDLNQSNTAYDSNFNV